MVSVVIAVAANVAAGSYQLQMQSPGGAVVASGVENLAYEARRFIATAEKAAIGAATAALIPNGASLFINIGTTTEEVARALIHHEGLLVITNNIITAPLFSSVRVGSVAPPRSLRA